MSETFHFLRPAFLCGLVLVPFFFKRTHFSDKSAGPWKRICDAHLLRHLLIRPGHRPSKALPWALAGLWALACVALAGPAWEKTPRPAFRTAITHVAILDFSQSMRKKDPPPARYRRAKLILRDFLNVRPTARVALIASGAEPYLISPPSQDHDILRNMLTPLSPDYMPGTGARPDRALQMAENILARLEKGPGHVLLFTDKMGEAPGNAILAARALKKAGHRLSVIAMGPQGSGSKDLTALAEEGGGLFIRPGPSNSGVKQLAGLSKSLDPFRESQKKSHREEANWQDAGVWLLPVLILGFSLAFRRGWIAVLFLTLTLGTPACAGGVESLFLSPDQRGLKALQKGAPDKAADLFSDPLWRGVALYRKGDFEAAARAFENARPTPRALYNLGNALARQGRLKEAIKAYSRALEKKPDHKDARHNRKLLEDLLKEQKKNQTPPDKDRQKNQEKKPSPESERKPPEKDRRPEEKEKKEPPPKKQKPQEMTEKPLEERQQRRRQMLQKVPDNPGGYLRRKILRDYEKNRYKNNGS